MISEYKLYNKEGKVEWVLLRPEDYEKLRQLAEAKEEPVNPIAASQSAAQNDTGNTEQTVPIQNPALHGPRVIGPATIQDILSGGPKKYVADDPGERWSPRKKRRSSPGFVSYESVVGAKELNSDRELPHTGSRSDQIRKEKEHRLSKSQKQKKRNR